MQIDNKELAVIKGQVSKLENQALAVKIESQEEYTTAIDIVSRLKTIGSTIKQKKESVTKPLNEALRNVRNLFAPLEEQYTKAESIIKGKLLDYKRQKDAEAAAEEAKIAAKVESGKMRLETGEKKLEQIERVENTTRGKVGEVSVRKIKKVRITNESLIPREYLEPNMVAIRRDALGGKQIAGVEVYEEESLAAGSY